MQRSSLSKLMPALSRRSRVSFEITLCDSKQSRSLHSVISKETRERLESAGISLERLERCIKEIYCMKEKPIRTPAAIPSVQSMVEQLGRAAIRLEHNLAIQTLPAPGPRPKIEGPPREEHLPDPHQMQHFRAFRPPEREEADGDDDPGPNPHRPHER